MKTQHTKGPWSSDDDMIDVSDQADMIKDNIGTDREWQSVGVHDGEGMAEIVALCHPINARLIAAAPDLLSFAQDIHCWLASPDLSPGVIAAYREDARVVIAKATGGKI